MPAELNTGDDPAMLLRNKRSFEDVEDDYEYRVAGFELQKLLMAITAAGALAFLLYLLWHCSCPGGGSGDRAAAADSREGDEREAGTRRVVYRKDSSTLFFTELEPGVVLLQSQDGEIFRILHEYEAARPGTGSGSTGASATSLCTGSRRDSGGSLHYFPSCTRLQSPPSAPPPSHDLHLIDVPVPPLPPPPYSSHVLPQQQR